MSSQTDKPKIYPTSMLGIFFARLFEIGQISSKLGARAERINKNRVVYEYMLLVNKYQFASSN